MLTLVIQMPISSHLEDRCKQLYLLIMLSFIVTSGRHVFRPVAFAITCQLFPLLLKYRLEIVSGF